MNALFPMWCVVSLALPLALLRGQWDSSARLIRCFERLSWATEVRWPSSDDIGRRTNTLAGADVGYQGEST